MCIYMFGYVLQARRNLEKLKASYMSKLELIEKIQSDATTYFKGDIKFHLSSLLAQIKWKLQRTVSSLLWKCEQFSCSNMIVKTCDFL